mmetsp:Transcript_11821/g.28662  ORF Transcript_11821/g.28662 Transcript_11821/m.28662 type:complete len:210 (-) Transcript_11821:458-1087(-)
MTSSSSFSSSPAGMSALSSGCWSEAAAGGSARVGDTLRSKVDAEDAASPPSSLLPALRAPSEVSAGDAPRFLAGEERGVAAFVDGGGAGFFGLGFGFFSTMPAAYHEVFFAGFGWPPGGGMSGCSFVEKMLSASTQSIASFCHCSSSFLASTHSVHSSQASTHSALVFAHFLTMMGLSFSITEWISLSTVQKSSGVDALCIRSSKSLFQ